MQEKNQVYLFQEFTQIYIYYPKWYNSYRNIMHRGDFGVHYDLFDDSYDCLIHVRRIIM